MIIAPPSRPGQVITRFVPNNDADKKPDQQSRLTDKTFRPTLMLGDPVVHYIWPIYNGDRQTERRIRETVHSLTMLGWGIDMAYADAQFIPSEKINELSGIRWYPRKDVTRDDGMLRVPILDHATAINSLNDLKRAHMSALDRIKHGKPLNTVEKPNVFGRVFYESTERVLGRPYEVFELRQDDGGRFKYPLNKLIHIAGMVRHLAIKRMKQSPPDGVNDTWVDTYVAGHVRPDEIEHRQFSYVPLPSVGYIHTDPSVRRAMIVAPLGDDRFAHHLAISLSGEQLEPTDEADLEQPIRH